MGVDHGVAGTAVLRYANVVDAGLLAAKLVEETLHHLRALRDSLAAVGDAGLADPLLQVLDVVVDVAIDVSKGFLQVRR